MAAVQLSPHPEPLPFTQPVPLQELEKRYEMALELLGERNEHVDKLEDDIREMKEIFHSQLSLMADQLSMAMSSEQQKPLMADERPMAMQAAGA